MGVSDETVSRLERGKLDPSVPTLLRIADALRADVDYLLGRHGTPRTRRRESPHFDRLRVAVERLDAKSRGLVVQLVERLAAAGDRDSKRR